MRIGMGCPAACYLRSLLKKETEAKEALNAAMAEAKAQAAGAPRNVMQRLQPAEAYRCPGQPHCATVAHSHSFSDGRSSTNYPRYAVRHRVLAHRAVDNGDCIPGRRFKVLLQCCSVWLGYLEPDLKPDQLLLEGFHHRFLLHWTRTNKQIRTQASKKGVNSTETEAAATAAEWKVVQVTFYLLVVWSQSR